MGNESRERERERDWYAALVFRQAMCFPDCLERARERERKRERESVDARMTTRMYRQLRGRRI